MVARDVIKEGSKWQVGDESYIEVSTHKWLTHKIETLWILAFRDFQVSIFYLLMRLICNLHSSPSLFARFVAIPLKYVWRHLLAARDVIKKGSKWQVGDESYIEVSTHKWLTHKIETLWILAFRDIQVSIFYLLMQLIYSLHCSPSLFLDLLQFLFLLLPFELGLRLV